MKQKSKGTKLDKSNELLPPLGLQCSGVIFNITEKRITLQREISGRELWSLMRELQRDYETGFYKYVPPILAMSRLRFELTDGWTIDDESRKYLKRTILYESEDSTEDQAWYSPDLEEHKAWLSAADYIPAEIVWETLGRDL